MPLFRDFLTPPSTSDVRGLLLSLLGLAGFPVTAWQPGSIARHLVEAFAEFGADAAKLITLIARSGFLDTAEGAWLDLLAASVFQEHRKAAMAAQGYVLLRDVSGQGPFTIEPDAFWVGNAARTRRFRSAEVATVPAAGEALVLFEAEGPGAAWNISDGAITELLTPGGTGLEVSNPSRGPDSWIVRPGADREEDAAFRQRCRDKWATLGSGSTAAAYRYWASSAASDVTRVRVDADGATGVVTVLVAGPSAPVSPASFAKVAAMLEQRRPLTVRVVAQNASTRTVPVEGVIELAAGVDAALVVAAAEDAIGAYALTIGIGDAVRRAKLIAAAVSVPGARNVLLAQPVDDVAMAADQVFVPAVSLVARSI